MFAQTRPGMQEGPEGVRTPDPAGVPASASPIAPNPSMAGWDVCVAGSIKGERLPPRSVAGGPAENRRRQKGGQWTG